MSIILNAAATNNADWKIQFQFNDADTDALIDFAAAVIEIDVKDKNCCTLIQASTTNGRITIVSTGVIQLLIPASVMESLCPDTYLVGGVYSLNGATISLFTGTLTVENGIARL